MSYIKLLRPKNYIKNLLILLPVVFSVNLFKTELIPSIIFSFVAFSALSSAVYIFNDLCDINKDKTHPYKSKRPIASGEVSSKLAGVIFAVLLCVCALFNYLACGVQLKAWLLLAVYLLQNIFYSLKLKNVPILDIAIIAAGFLIRIFYGSIIFDIGISRWLYLTVLVASFYLGLSKRRNELALVENDSTRDVLSFYNYNFLDKNMHICSALTIVFYSLWSIDNSTVSGFDKGYLLWTIPVVILICITYNFEVEKSCKDDVVDILLGSKPLMALILLLGIMLLGIVYIPSFIN